VANAERRLSLDVVIIEVPAEETLNKPQPEPLEEPEPPVGGIEFLGRPPGKFSDYLDLYSKSALPFEAVSYSYHFPPGRALVFGVGFWIWLLEESIPVDDGQRLFRIGL
jgi:hypothetical protein